MSQVFEIPRFMEKKRFDYKEIEPKIQEFWQEAEIFRCEDLDSEQLKLIDTPPPFANGKLHHGHGMSYTQLDIIARYLRQRYPTLLPLAFDDNGLPTERYTEEKYDINPGEHPDDFFELCKHEAKEAIKHQQEQFEAIGFSYNHEISYTTIDERSMRLTQADFIQLYDKGVIQREQEPQLFCPHCQTALAQADLESESRETELHYISFLSNNGEIEIATTRPELIPAAVAIFYNPSDTRFDMDDLIIYDPIEGRELELIEDPSIDMNFGTGLMMCSTFGDQHDIELYRKYGLPMRSIINQDGAMTRLEIIEGMSIEEARSEIIEILKERGHWSHSERIEHSYSACERCSTPIEIIESPQWKIDIMSIKDEILEYIRDINIIPNHMRKRLRNWIKGLKWNWIISRQRIFGIPIPAWHCTECNLIQFPETEELPMYHEDLTSRSGTCEQCDGNLRADGDVFDTWMASSLTPRVLYDKYFDAELEKPLALRSQAHEIIRTWAFYTIIKQYLSGKKQTIPWNDLLISGWGLGFKGKGKRGIKASKSAGTGHNPKDLVKEYGADAFRYWAAQARLGKDQHLREPDLNRGRKLVTKIYNAAKITKTIATGNNPAEKSCLKSKKQEITEHLQDLETNYEKYMSNYNYTDALELLEHDFWDQYCSTWIELFKDYHYNEQISKEDQEFILITFKRYLRWFAPFLPFITEYLSIILWKIDQNSDNYISIHSSH